MRGLVLVEGRLLRELAQVLVDLLDQLVLSVHLFHLWRLENPIIALVRIVVGVGLVWVGRGCRPSQSFGQVPPLERG